MRDKKIDILKGLAIIAVVLGHCGAFLKPYIYLFHMAVFIMASGYCFKSDSVCNKEKFKRYLWKKMKGLYVPYVCFNGLFLGLYNFLLKINIYTDNINFHNPMESKKWWQIVNSFTALIHFDASATQQLCGAGWFVIVLFYIVVFWGIFIYILQMIKSKVLFHGIIVISAILSLIIGNLLRTNNLFLNGYLSPTFSCYALFVLGYYIKNFSEYINKVIEKLSYIIVVLGLVFLYFVEKYGSISLNVNHYTTPCFLILCSMMGWLVLSSAAYIIEKWSIHLTKLLCYVGKKTIWILFLHFISFKFITVLELAVYGKPTYLLASFPVYITESGWWILYAIAGVGFPLLCELIFRNIKGKIIMIATSKNRI